MKLLRQKKRWTDDKQNFHLIEKKGWKNQQSQYENLLNLHIHTFCGIERVLIPGDDYVDFDKSKHKRKICKDCFKVFSSKNKRVVPIKR